MTRVLSVDPGFTNLGLFGYDTLTKTFFSWGVHALPPSPDLNDRVLAWLQINTPLVSLVDVWLIEKQMSFNRSRFAQMLPSKIVETALYSVAAMRGHGARRIEPALVKRHHKTAIAAANRKKFPGKKAYYENKRRGVAYARLLVGRLCPLEVREWFEALKKKDDAADAFLQLIYFLQIEHKLFLDVPKYDSATVIQRWWRAKHPKPISPR